MPSSEQKHAVLAAIRQHKSLVAGAHAVGISHRTLQSWRQNDTDFAEEVRMTLRSVGDDPDEGYAEPESGPALAIYDTPAPSGMGDSEPLPFESPDVGMALPQPWPLDPEPEPEPEPEPRDDHGRTAADLLAAMGIHPPESALGVAPRIVHSVLPPPPEPPLPAPAPGKNVPVPVDLSSPVVTARLQKLAVRIRDDATFARNLRVRLAIMQSGDQGELTDLLDVIRGV